MLSKLGTEIQRWQDEPNVPKPCALWSADLKLTHVDCSPNDPLVHFQGQYLTVCELDYNKLQVEIQNAPKTKASVEVGEFCLVQDTISGRWYRGRVQNQQNGLFDVFLTDHGNILSVSVSHLAFASDDLFMLPPKIVCGFLANVLPLGKCWDNLSAKYFCSKVGTNIKGYIQALLPHKVLILEVPEIVRDMLRLSLGKNVDRTTFLLLVEMLTDVPLKQNSQPAPDLLTEKQIGQEFSFKPSNLKDLQNKLSFFGTKLSVGCKERVRVTAAMDSNNFYCQLASVAEDLKGMSDKLSFFCESKSKDLPDQPMGNLGLLCSVRGKDEKWHRGFVQYLPVNSQVRVFFVDYGFYESVKVENILPLPWDFLSVPIMAFPCALSCLGERDDSRKQQMDYLKKGLLGQALDIRINSVKTEENLHCITLLSAEVDCKMELQISRSLKNQTKCNVPPQDRSPLQNTNETKNIKTLGHSVNLEAMKDSIFEGYVEHVLNPTDFWLRTEERNRDFVDMMNEMTEYFSALRLDEEILENPVPGALCCAMYESDMHYYRAVVMDTIENGAKVFFIDFGNTEKVPYMLIKKIPPRFSIKPEFAVNCSLAHVVPVEDFWTANATDYFRKLVSNKALLVQVVERKKDRFIVDLYEKGIGANESIAVLMTTAKLVEFWKCTPIPSFYPGGRAKQSQQKINKRKVTDSSASKVPKKHWNMKTVLSAGFCAKKPKHVLETETPEQQTHVAVAAFKQQTFRAGSELTVQCCHIGSPSDFWCQRQRNLNSLDKLMINMQKYYHTYTDPLQPNEVCCVAKYPVDGRWYRARILGAQDGEVSVILVDFGVMLKEKAHNLRAIKQEYLEPEEHAFRCSLYELMEPADRNRAAWIKDASSLLKKFTCSASSDLKCTIYTQLDVEGQGVLNLVDLHTSHQSVTKLLVGGGLAREVPFPKQLIPTSTLNSYIFSMFNIKLGNEEPVYVTHVCSPWEFYCQLDRNCAALEDLMGRVMKQISSMLENDSRGCQGRLCLAKYLVDGEWYRGLTFPVQSNLYLNVLFVDYGNMQVVAKSTVLTIPRHATDLLFEPMQALRCCLSEIPKGDVLAEVNYMLEKATLNKKLQAKFLSKDEDGTLVCDLFDGNIHINKKVRELIAAHRLNEKNCVSRPIPNNAKWNRREKVKEQNRLKTKVTSEKSPCHAQHGSDRTTSLTYTRVLSSKSPGGMQKQESQVHHHKAQASQSTPLKSRENKTVRKLHKEEKCRPCKPLAVSNVALPKLSHLPETTIKPGYKCVGFISHVNTVASFYIQKQSDEQAILKICEELNQASLKRDSEVITREVNIGDLVAAAYEEDGALYRAVVIDVSDSQLKVEFIDYGNAATVEKKKLRILSGAASVKPRLSIPCSLEESLRVWDDNSFSDSVTDKPLMVEFVKQCGTQWKVNVKIHEGPPHSNEEEKGDETHPSLLTKKLSVDEVVSLGETQTKESCTHTRATESLDVTNKATECNPKTPTESKKSSLYPSSQEALSTTSSNSSETKPEACNREMNVQIKSSKQKSEKYHPVLCNLPDTETNQRFTVPEPMSHVGATSSLPLNEPTARPMEGTTILSQNISSGQTENGTLLSILENGDFYFRLLRNSELLALLGQLIAENVVKCNLISVGDVKKGLECLAKSGKNNEWHRAVVWKELSGQQAYSVFLLDCGVTEVVPVVYVRELCNELRQIPMQAVLCRWNDPTQATGDDFEVVIESLKPMEQDIKLEFLSYSDTAQLWMVKVVQQLGNIASVKSEEEDRPSRLKMEAPTDGSLVCEDSRARKLLLAPVKTDLGHSGFSAAVTDPSEFYIVLEDLLLTMVTVSALLEELPEGLASLPEVLLTPGACCLVRSKMKKKWCRAEIVHVDSTSIVINLIDYGHCECIPYACCEKLKKLPEELAALPKVAYPCVLRGVMPAREGPWAGLAVVFFQERICRSHLQIYFRQFVSEAQWEVDIMSGGVNVARELVDAGHACYVDPMLGLYLRQEPVSVGTSRQESLPTSVDNASKNQTEPEGARRGREQAFYLKPLERMQELNGRGFITQRSEEYRSYDTEHRRSEETCDLGSGEESREKGPAKEFCDTEGTGENRVSGAQPVMGKCALM